MSNNSSPSIAHQSPSNSGISDQSDDDITLKSTSSIKKRRKGPILSDDSEDETRDDGRRYLMDLQ